MPVVPLGLGVIAVAEHLVGLERASRPLSSSSVDRLTIDLPESLGGDVTVHFAVAAAIVMLVVLLAASAAGRMTRGTQVN